MQLQIDNRALEAAPVTCVLQLHAGALFCARCVLIIISIFPISLSVLRADKSITLFLLEKMAALALAASLPDRSFAQCQQLRSLLQIN
jgi:hypothetical protein